MLKIFNKNNTRITFYEKENFNQNFSLYSDFLYYFGIEISEKIFSIIKHWKNIIGIIPLLINLVYYNNKINKNNNNKKNIMNSNIATKSFNNCIMEYFDPVKDFNNWQLKII